MFVSSRTNIKFLPVKLILFSSASLSNLAVITNTLPLYHPLTSSCLYNHLNFAQIHLLPVCKNTYPLAFSCVKIEACDLIDKTDISMEDVAEKVGFITPSTFNRNFRRIIGTSPYQWKKRPDNHEGKLLEYKISALKGW